MREIVLTELAHYSIIQILEAREEEIIVEYVNDFNILKNLKSVINVYIVRRDHYLNPSFISKHKSILGEMIEKVLKGSGDTFKSFKISCAGSDSQEVQDIEKYLSITFKLVSVEDADMKIFIGKSGGQWEIGIGITARPLSLRDYKVSNIKGGINPTIAYAMNSLSGLETAQSYLNICSGSATLLIEAAQINPSLRFIGFDYDKKSTSLAIQNLKKAKLITSVQLKVADVFLNPDFGMFDVITADLPFGMQISKGENLENLYKIFVDYCEQKLNKNGRLVIYTTEDDLLESILNTSKFIIIQTLELTVSTAVSASVYIHPKVFVCRFS